MGLPIYVINLDEDVERMAAMKRQLDKLGLPFVRFPGFRGAEITDRWKPQFPADNPLGAGEIGCYASHLQAIADMLETDEPARVILEDDGILSERFAALLAALPDRLPDDWDIVRFCTTLKHPVRRVVTLPFGYGLFTYSRIPNSALGYMINRRFAEHFTKPRVRRAPLDSELQHPFLFGDLTTYGIEPSPIGYVPTSPSRIAAIGRTSHVGSRLRRSMILRREIHAMRKQGISLRVRFHTRRLILSFTAARPYRLDQLEVR